MSELGEEIFFHLEPEQQLQFAATIFLSKMQGLGEEAKFTLIREGGESSQAEAQKRYTLATAEILQDLKEEEKIRDWYPIPFNSQLDGLFVDFLIEEKSGQIKPLQVTSGATRGQERRKKNTFVLPRRKSSRSLLPRLET